MAYLIVIGSFILFCVMIVGPIVFFHSRKILRKQKNYERGLKMVTLLIHLPPPSDDTDVGSRDIRDVTDENISRAEFIYNIISSTLQKGFRSSFYGQRHVGLEIVCMKGFVHLYASVPVNLVEVVKQAVTSAYPSSRLEEVQDYNLFNKVGGINATIGGELTLKQKFGYPIGTYRDIKRDPMQSLLNAMSSLGDEDGVGVQFLIRPAMDGWRKQASSLASDKRKGKESRSGSGAALWWVKQTFTALTKPPEDLSSENESKKPPKELSSHEQEIYNAIDEKTKHPGFETNIRIIASANVLQRSQEILSNVVASFSLYDAPGRNGFKWSLAQDIEEFTTAYILKIFPQHHNKNILNSVELATLFHFPQQEDIPTSQLSRQDSKQVDGPRNMPDHGLLLGYNVFRGAKKPIRLSLEDRQRHMYVVGQTGTGKSTFLEDLALQDMLMGNGFAFIDPHGDVADKLLGMVPKERTEDVIYFCPSDTDYPLGLNVFEAKNDDEKDFVIQEVINMIQKLYDPNNQGIVGARYHHMFRNAALAVMADPAGGSFIDIPKLFADKDFLANKLKHVKDQNVLDFWQKEFPNSMRSSDGGEVVSWFVSKFGAFLSNSMMRNIIGQIESSFDLRKIMDEKKILIVNLSKGRTGELNSKLLGMIFVMKFQAAAMSRANIPIDQRVDFCLYVDEFQNFSTDSFATIMSEARKYKLNLIVANQFTTQLTEEIRDAVFGNVGTTIAFRIGQNDVDVLSRYFQPLFDGDDLLRVPNFNTIVRTLVGGVPTQAFSMSILPPLGNPNPELGMAMKRLSAAKFGRPRATVDKEITDRMRKSSSSSVPANGFGQTNGGFQASTPGGASAGYQQPGPPKQKSFLDQWLDKKQKQAPATSGIDAGKANVARADSTPKTTAPHNRGGSSVARPNSDQSNIQEASKASSFKAENGFDKNDESKTGLGRPDSFGSRQSVVNQEYVNLPKSSDQKTSPRHHNSKKHQKESTDASEGTINLR